MMAPASDAGRGRQRRVVVALLALLVVTQLAPGAPRAAASPAGTAPGTAEEQLAAKYQPFLAIREHVTACGPGEAFLPTDALAIIGQPDVVLRDGDGREITTGPTAADLAAAPDDGTIDFPGSPLKEDCSVEQWFRSTGPPRNVVYARITFEHGHPDRLVLQYWYFFMFNDWNNRHEGDWEMMQLIFDAGSAAEALTQEPSAVVLAQHDGAERAAWADVEQRDGRPVVYIARGSHATFFEAARWIGTSGQTGFGCDDTRPPSTVLDTDLEVVPTTIDRDGAFGWLLWEGSWGQRSAGGAPSEGPVGTPMWATPISWTDELARTTSFKAPDFGSATDFFCSASTKGSVLLNKILDEPLVVGGLVLLAVLAAVAVGRRTRWTRLPRPLAARRASGQVLTSAAALLRAEHRRFRTIAALLVAGGTAATLWRELLLRVDIVHNAHLLVTNGEASSTLFALLTGSVITLPVFVLACSLAIVVADALDEPAAPGTFRLASRPGFRRVLAMVVLALVLLGPVSFLLGLYLVGRWAAGPVLALRGGPANDGSGLGFTAALRGSAVLTKGRRLRVGIVLVVAVVIATLAGPLIGTLALILTSMPLIYVNLLAAVISAVLVPWLAIVVVMLHRNLTA